MRLRVCLVWVEFKELNVFKSLGRSDTLRAHGICTRPENSGFAKDPS